jgi:hypothetical protein
VTDAAAETGPRWRIAFCMVYRKGVVIMLAQLERQGVMRPNRLVDPEDCNGYRLCFGHHLDR